MRQLIAVIYLIGSLLVLSSLAAGQEVTDRYSADYRKCIDKAGNTTAMLSCVAAEKSRWDARLGNAYAVLIGSSAFSSEAKRRLSEAQKLWRIFQGKSCDADAALEIEGGTGFNLAKAGCTLQMTAQRTVELERFLRLRENTRESPGAEEHRLGNSKPSR